MSWKDEIALAKQSGPDANDWRQEIIGAKRRQAPDTELLRQMHGQLPGGLPKGVPLQKEAELAEVGRQGAFDELISRGYVPDQLDLAAKTYKHIDPGFTEALKANLGQTIGGIAGGAVGPLVLGQIPPFTALPEELLTVPLTAAIGAGIGGGAGKTAQVATMEGRAPRAGELLRAMGEEAGFELGGRYAAIGAKALFSPLIKKTLPEAAELMEDYARVGGHFTPAEMDKRWTVKAAESISRGSWGGKDIFTQFEPKDAASVLAFADEVVESFAEGIARRSPSEIGQAFISSIERPSGRVFQQLDELFTPLYSQIDELTRGAGVSTQRLKALAATELATDGRLNKQYLSASGRKTLNSIKDLPDKLSFGDMRTLRSSYLKDVRKLARDVDRSEAIIKRVASAADEAMFDPKAAEGLTTEARNLLLNTNRLYKTAQGVLKETLPEQLAKRITKNPAGVIGEIFRPKNDVAIRNMRLALTRTARGAKDFEGEILWQELKRAWLAEVVDKASMTGQLSGRKFDTMWHRMGKNALNEMFSPDEQARIQKISTLLGVKGVGAASTPLFTKSLQIGGLFLMWRGAQEGDFVGIGAGGAMALGPIAFAKLAVSPTGAKLLSAGLKLKPGSTQLAPILARMVRLLTTETAKEAEQKQKAAVRAKTKRPSPSLRELRGFGGRGL